MILAVYCSSNRLETSRHMTTGMMGMLITHMRWTGKTSRETTIKTHSHGLYKTMMKKRWFLACHMVISTVEIMMMVKIWHSSSSRCSTAQCHTQSADSQMTSSCV